MSEDLKKFGYCDMFADRENLSEVVDWINSTHNPAQTMTGAMMYVNTLLRELDAAGMLNKDKK